MWSVSQKGAVVSIPSMKRGPRGEDASAVFVAVNATVSIPSMKRGPRGAAAIAATPKWAGLNPLDEEGP